MLPSKNIADKTGEKYNMLIVLSFSHLDKNRRAVWKCKCNCGKYVLKSAQYLTTGQSQSCGCFNLKAGHIDLIGKKFNKLTVIKDSGERQKHSIKWICKCDCGNFAKVISYNLTGGHTKSCGCLRVKNITGKRFGMLVVIKATSLRRKRAHSKEVIWECKCDCGKIKFLDSSRLKLYKSCGCMQNKSRRTLPDEAYILYPHNVNKRMRRYLSDGYVKQQLKRKGRGRMSLKESDITPEIIALKRVQLKFHREIKKGKGVLNELY